MKKGLTFVEVLVSSIILASVLAGVIATFVSTRRVVGRSTERVAASNLIRQQLDSLYSAVRADTMDNNGEPLEADTVHNLPAGGNNLGTQTIDNIQYDVNYTVGTDPSGNEYRPVTVTVDFTVPG